MGRPKEPLMKVVISDPKTGLSIQVDFKDVQKLIGKKIGDIIPGEWFGLEGYKLQITGGSDFAGFPMAKEVEGTGKKRVWRWVKYRWVVKKKGTRTKKSKWIRVKRLVRGNTISEEIVQVNTKIVEYGSKPFEEIYNEWKQQKGQGQ